MDKTIKAIKPLLGFIAYFTKRKMECRKFYTRHSIYDYNLVDYINIPAILAMTQIIFSIQNFSGKSFIHKMKLSWEYFI